MVAMGFWTGERVPFGYKSETVPHTISHELNLLKNGFFLQFDDIGLHLSFDGYLRAYQYDRANKMAAPRQIDEFPIASPGDGLDRGGEGRAVEVECECRRRRSLPGVRYRQDGGAPVPAACTSAGEATDKAAHSGWVSIDHQLIIGRPLRLLLPPFGPGRRQSHKRERLLIVALLSMQGRSANSIAKALCISPATIRRDRQRVGYALQKAMAAAGLATGIAADVDVDAGESKSKGSGAEKSRVAGRASAMTLSRAL